MASSISIPPVEAPVRSPLMRILTLAVIVASGLGSCLVFSATQPLLPLLAAHFGGPGAVLMSQLVQTTPGLGMLFGGLIAGWVLSKTGKRPLILASIIAIGVFGAAGGLVDSRWLFLGSRFLLGVAAVWLSTACVTLMAELYDGAGRAKVMAGLQSASTFSAVLLVPVAGVLADRFGWRMPFWFFVIYAVPVFLIALTAIQGRQATAGGESEHSDKGAVGAALKLWPFLLLIFCFSQLNTMGVTQLPFLLKEEGLKGAGLGGLIMAGDALVMGVGAILSAPLIIKLGEQRALVISLLVAGIGNIVAGLPAHGIVLTAGGSIFSYLGCGVQLALAYALILNRISPEARGVAVGFVHAAMFVSQFANAFILGPIGARIGLHGVYLLVGAVATVGPFIGLAILRMRRGPGAPTAPAPVERATASEL